MADHSITPRAFALGVVTALLAGIVASLAIRPPGQAARSEAGDATAATIDAIHWRIATTIGTNIPVIGDAPLTLRDELAVLSDGAIRLDIYEPGELAPVGAISESVREGKIPAAMTWLGYDQGRIPASTLIAAVPFGMEPTEFSAWWYVGGGRELGEALYHEHDIHPVLCRLIGPETAGWFREPIDGVEDLDGLKIRFAGLGGKVLQRAGASVTMLPGAEIFQALEKGAIDATEFSLPSVDQLLGFDRVARYNYFPGWHQPFTSAHFIVNLDTWRALGARTRTMIEVSCRASVATTLARSEAAQGAVIRDFAAKGVIAGSLPDDVLRQLRDIARSVLDEEAERDDRFAEILASQRAFADVFAHWKRKAYLPRDF